MWMRARKTRFGKICCLALSLSLSALLLGCTSASAQEKMYGITETELTLLEANLNELSNVNSEQREKLKLLQEKLTDSETKLKLSERTSATLGARLNLLSKELTEQASSLENANRLLQQYEQEERRMRSRLKRQRNIGYILAAVAVIFFAANSG